MEGQLDNINQAVASLQTSVSQLSGQVNENGESAAADAAEPMMSSIKSQSKDVETLVGAADQLLCPSGTCPQGTTVSSFSSALATVCPPFKTDSAACQKFYNVVNPIKKELGADAGNVSTKLTTLAFDAIGSAANGSPTAAAGVVQYAIEGGSQLGSAGFYQSADAAPARVDWAYYLLATQVAQVSEAIAGSLSIGLHGPGSTAAHPSTVSAADVAKDVAKINPIIDAYLGAFPNFPDTAVITTGAGLPDGDAPYMFAQQVGAVVTSGIYTGDGSVNFDLSANGTAGDPSPAIKGQNGTQLALTWSGGSAPIVLTPLGGTAPNASGTTGTWQLLPPAPGGTAPSVPAMTAAQFQNWQFAEATSLTAQSQPDWNGSSVSWDSNPLGGPLADLYYWVHDGNSPGQSMTSGSGIAEQLLFPQGQTYGTSGNTGLSYYYTRTQTSDNNAALGIAPCSPAANTSCLLPTWLSTAVNATSNNPGYNSGVFDFNNGVAVDNQNVANPVGGACTDCADGQAWLNTYQNWETTTYPSGNIADGVVSALNGTNVGTYPSLSSNGRPVLFDRQQASNDCFYWTGAASASAAQGSGCLTQRLTSSAVLPAVDTNY